MCNINAVFKKPGIDCTQQMSDMSAVSFAKNSDGEGIFTSASDKVTKTDGRLNVLRMRREITDSDVIITHERYTTSGFSKENTQPFENERFVLAHNGVFWKTWDDEPAVEGATDENIPAWQCGYSMRKSDTAIFFDKFVAQFAASKNMAAAIGVALDKMGGGSYSIIIYDKLEKRTFYLKNFSTVMFVGRMRDGTMVMSTNPSNLDIFWDVESTEIPLEDRLYEIKYQKGKYDMIDLGKITRHVEDTAVDDFGFDLDPFPASGTIDKKIEWGIITSVYLCLSPFIMMIWILSVLMNIPFSIWDSVFSMKKMISQITTV